MLVRREVLYGAKFVHEFLEVFICKLCPIVDDARLGNTEVGKDVSSIEIENVLSCDFGQGLSFYPFYEVVYPLDEVFVLVGSHYKGFDDVQGPPCKGPWERLGFELIGRC